jgi:hypothetical protein
MNVLSGASFALALALTAPAAAAEDFKDSPYYPMQVGATWTYKAGDSKFVVKAIKHEKIGATNCARIETLRDGKVVGTEDVFVKDDSVYRMASDDKQVDPPVLILKLPPKVGEVWNIESKSTTKTGVETLKATFTENGEEVTTPLDKFAAVTVSCEDLDANGAKYSFKTYYAKDVGMVKQEITAGGLKIVIELEKYEAAPAPK